MQNFFEKLPKAEIEAIFKKNIFDKCQITIDGKTNEVVRVNLTSSEVEKFKKIYILPIEVYELKDKMCAFSFRIGTRVFFFKAKILMDGKGFYISSNIEMLELRRRRHVRFEVPDNFPHEVFVITSLNKNARVEAKLLNFSESGAKMLVMGDLLLFQRGTGVIISLKVGKRAVFLAGGIIRFVSRKPKENPELGIEFVNLTEIKKSRILNVCEDLTRLIVQANRKQRR
ncbi:hypothetical protein CIK05_13290 [Bdellovibrio sp. qaytius]|nr:hypothetical protein CIK05_13290 [Bdellovibrio sp. qaytius]